MDAALVTIVGYRDLRDLEYEPPLLIPLIGLPLAFYAIEVREPHPLLLLLIAAIIIPFTLMTLVGRLGVGDLIIPLRIPIIPIASGTTLIAPLALALLFIGMAAAYLYYYYTRMKNIMCGRGMVRKEALALKYVFPKELDVNAPWEEIEKAKKKLMESGRDCVEAYPAIPYLFIFSIGYSLATMLILTWFLW